MSDSTRGSRLLAAILDGPRDDDAPRLVYADWLCEQDDPRGEFIHIQCALGRAVRGTRLRVRAPGRAGTYDEQETAALAQRERVLLKKHQKAWLEPIRAHVRTWTWLRGFVTKVVADGAKYVAGASDVFAATPLDGVKLTAMKRPQFEALVAHPTTTRLRELDVNQQKIDARIAPVFRDACWKQLRVLDLGGNQIGVEAARVLAEAPFDALESLNLAQAEVTDEALAIIAHAPYFARLHTLRLGWNAALTPRAVETIAETGAALRELDLAANTVGDAGALAIARSPKLAQLRKLRLNWDVMPAGVDALLASLGQLVELERVDRASDARIAEVLGARRAES